MGHHVDKKERDREDRYELGTVDNVHDLEPETGVGPTRAAKAQARIENPESAGYFEIQGGSRGGLGMPLQLGKELKDDGGPKIGEYEIGYNTYAAPLRSTLRAMGRLKDVSLTGAPLTPQELMKRPDLAARFARLSPEKMNVQQNQAFDVWSTQQTKMRNDIQHYGAGQHQLAGIIANYRRVQARLQEQRAEWERTKKTKEVGEIAEASETLAHVVEMAFAASAAVRGVEEALEAHVSFNENAEGLGSIDDLPQSNNPNWEFGTVDDPTGVSQSTKTKMQRLAGGGKDVAENKKTSNEILRDAKEKLENTGKLELSLEGLFTAASGQAGTYSALQKEISTLTAQVAKLHLEQGQDDLESANQQLLGFKIELAARTMDVRADRAAARKGARTFAQSIAAGDPGLGAMYAAEAYRELAAFGQLAVEQRRGFVDPLWRSVHDYIYGVDAHRFSAIAAYDDARALATNLQVVVEQKTYFQEQLPEWRKLANDWTVFLREHTGTSLIAGSNEADRASEAP